jgi:hypothetical protein
VFFLGLASQDGFKVQFQSDSSCDSGSIKR